MSKLFTPIDISTLHLRNRFAMAPMTRGKSPGGVPNDENVEHYRRRAAGGVGLIITEGTYVRGPAAGPSPDVPRIYGQASGRGWARVVQAVHDEGASIVPQLWHTGVTRGALPDFEPDQLSVSPSGLDLNGTELGRQLTDDDLESIIASFVESAQLAQSVGFDGVELHGAHGYLLDQFFWDRTNRRDDQFGGTIEARSAFPAHVVRAIRAAVGPSFPIVYRFSQWKAGQYDAQIAADPGELHTILTPLVEAGVDVFHVSTRRHWLPGFDTPDDHTGLAGWTKRVTGRPVITVGSVGVDSVFRSEHEAVEHSTRERLDMLEQQFERDEFDIVAVGRALLADAEWVDKLRTGRFDEITPFQSRS
jgi:2,4-dienoyl-CoA reductase-like NADH-dependent reductase (Old Yellow Enzyme family)